MPAYVRVVILYAFFATMYALLYRPFIFLLTPEPDLAASLADIRGLTIVFITTILLFLLLRRGARQQEKIEAQEKLHLAQMAQADKLITLGTLVSGVAHEINNPINFITLNLPLIREFWQGARPILEAEFERSGDFSVGRLKYSVLRERIDKMFDGISEGTDRIKGIVSTLKEFARPDPSDMTQPVDPNQAIASGARLMQPAIARATERFSLELDPAVPPLVGSSQKLEQMAVNLIQNALESLPSKEAAVAVSSRYDHRRRATVIEVRDEGSGIDPEILPRITDPFFTTKRGAGGMGLGLAISSQIVHDHGGSMEFSSELGVGTTVTIVFPSPPGHEGAR